MQIGRFIIFIAIAGIVENLVNSGCGWRDCNSVAFLVNTPIAL
jgi:hypothetical protein